MAEALGHEVTELLQAWRQGGERALEKLTPQVCRELHLAAMMRGRRLAKAWPLRELSGEKPHGA